jgi:hypothetical protein
MCEPTRGLLDTSVANDHEVIDAGLLLTSLRLPR